MSTIRVAAAQFGVGQDVDENLRTVLRMIDTAAAERPRVLVLPEFCNHLSIYDSAEHAWAVAIDHDGPWVSAVGARAAAHGMWIQMNVTLRRPPAGAGEPGIGSRRVTVTNLVFNPAGALSAINDKSVLMGAEGIFLSPADRPASLIETEFGIVGSYACMDGVVPEVPRSLAVRGAQLMLNSLNSFALDEASLHIPVRAAENRVFVVACCKVGPLLPADKVAEFSAAMGVPADLLRGAGESQIVSPIGEVIARAPRDGEAVIAADINLSHAGARRPDGTDVLGSRRPVVYAGLAAPTPPDDHHHRAERISAACAFDAATLHHALSSGSHLVVLPELCDVALTEIVDAIATLAPDALVVTSQRSAGPSGTSHTGIVVSAAGIQFEQAQLHHVGRHPWVTVLGDHLDTYDAPWGRLAVLVGDDHVHPEPARLAALQNADVLCVPYEPQERWESRTGLVERAAENRVCLVASCRPGLPGDSMVVNLPPDFTLWAPSRERVFDGTINMPDVVRGQGSVSGDLCPARSINRQISRNTDLVNGRPVFLGAILADPASRS